MTANQNPSTQTVILILSSLFVFYLLKSMFLRTFIRIKWKELNNIKKGSNVFLRISGLYLLKCNYLKNDIIYIISFISVKVELITLLLFLLILIFMNGLITYHILIMICIFSIVNLFCLCTYIVIKNK